MMRRRLRAIDQRQGAGAVRHRDHFRTGLMVPSAFETCATATIRGARVEQLLVLFQQQLAAVVHGDHAQPRAFFLAQHLPGDDVGVVLHAPK